MTFTVEDLVSAILTARSVEDIQVKLRATMIEKLSLKPSSSNAEPVNAGAPNIQ